MLAGDSEENDEKIQAFRAAQLHTRQAQQFHEKANSLRELLNLQSLHANVHIMSAYFTLLQEEIHKLLGNAKEEVTIIYLCFRGDTQTPWKCKGGGNNNIFVFSSITAVRSSNSIAHFSNPS